MVILNKMIVLVLVWLLSFLTSILMLHKKKRFIGKKQEYEYLNSNILHIKHKENIKKIQSIYIDNYNSKERSKIVLNTMNSKSMTIRNTDAYKKQKTRVNINYKDIIKLDTEKSLVHVGSMINMGKLSNYLFKHGYSLFVVPEFKSLTVGGLISGGGIESSSFKYGLFPLQCVEYTILLGNGKIKKVTEKQGNLFSSIPLSYGTLGTILDVKIKIKKIHKYVQLEIIPIKNYEMIQEELTAILQKKDELNYDFIEAISYRKDLCLVILGYNVETCKYTKFNNNIWRKPFFYQVVLNNYNNQKHIFNMDILDYYFRHDRGSFWLLKNIIGDGFLSRVINPFINRASDKVYIPQKIMKSLLKYRKIEVQDAVVPLRNVNNILDFVDKNYSTYPIWICPCLNVDTTFSHKKIVYKMIKKYINKILKGDAEIKNVLLDLLDKNQFYLLGIQLYCIINYDQKNLEKLITILGLENKIILYTNLYKEQEQDINYINKIISENADYIYAEKVDQIRRELLQHLTSTNRKNRKKYINSFLDAIKIKTSHFGLVLCTNNNDYFIDIGIYGKSDINKGMDINKKLNEFEKYTLKNDGFMAQYAITTLNREDFNTYVLRNEWYLYLRKKYKAKDIFPDIYDKLGSG